MLLKYAGTGHAASFTILLASVSPVPFVDDVRLPREYRDTVQTVKYVPAEGFSIGGRKLTGFAEEYARACFELVFPGFPNPIEYDDKRETKT